MATMIFASPIESSDRLTQLGLEIRHLVVPAQRGFLASSSCTPNHPPFYVGLTGWAETVRALREELSPHGWLRQDVHGLPLVISPDRTHALAVSAANMATGRQGENPSTKTGKGPITELVVEGNLPEQPRLFSIDSVEVSPQRTMYPWTVWMLLTHKDTAARELRCELSRPIHFDDSLRAVDDWSERIILPSTRFDDASFVIGQSDDTDRPETDFDIPRRG